MPENRNFTVGVDFPRVLETIASHIYDNQFAFLRENLQNAIDAVRIQASRDGRQVESGYRIDIRIDGNRCEIQDSGNGMTKEQLRLNYWTMGASGKHTEEAKRAGCIGTFGIGGFANFGVCDRLAVISRTANCSVTHETSLSKKEFSTLQGHLPTVKYKETNQLISNGTIVIGLAPVDFDKQSLLDYIKQFVTNVKEPVYFDGIKISGGKKRKIGDNYTPISDNVSDLTGNVQFSYQLYKDEGSSLAAEFIGASELGKEIDFSGFVRLENGSVRAFKRGFKICDVSISSRIGISGWFDSDLVIPTAGRDTVNAQSLSTITQIFRCVERRARELVVLDEELLAEHTRLLPDIAASGDLSLLGLLRVRTLDGGSYLLSEIEAMSQAARIFYSLSSASTPAAEVLQAKGDVVVSVSRDRNRRRAEVVYLSGRCKAKAFDNLIERLEPYVELDEFERALLAELDMAIRRLYQPEAFTFLPGSLTLDVPIFWSDKKEREKTIVYVDTRHGEFEKLRPLGYTPLLWSMIEAFSREFLGDTLKKRSTKFFGDGAVDLEAYVKSHAELWELVSSEIETSMLGSSEERLRRRGIGAQVQIVRTDDITQVQVSPGSTSADHSSHPGDLVNSSGIPGKLLEIVDKEGTTGLGGFYLRIPVSASKAFGEIIRTFSTFAVVWFANCITWSGTDDLDTAFLYHVTLEKLIHGVSDPHGVIELNSSCLQYFRDQVYFYIPRNFQRYLVPGEEERAIKVSVTHQLVDLGKSRAWTARNT
ncbi:ATP-binding protein [Candidatus Rariloculus sp.]|uniref:ATP-binding protein n=1 Tax=Candidatus Rariloculus sp. TaxID=3101265 RepID=UPI003D136FCC